MATAAAGPAPRLKVRGRVIAIAVALVLLALATPAAATLALAEEGFGPPAADAEVPKPGPTLKQMAYFVGEWSCTGRDSTPQGTSYPVVATASVRYTADGSWLLFDLAEQRTAENPEPLSGVWLWGYEPNDERFSAFFFDSLGNRTEQYAPGWRGNGLLFEGRIVGPGFQAPYRDVVTKHDEKSFTVTGQGYMLNEWITFQELDCRR